MKKLWFVGMVVLVVVLVTGAATAQMNPGPFHILHKQGAIFNSDTGWTVSTPPYYPGTDWAVDFNYHSQGMSILHKDGCIWEQGTGWVYSGYYAGSNYAQALEYLRDLRGCWGMEFMKWETILDDDGTNWDVYKFLWAYPNKYINITGQVGTRLYGEIVTYLPGIPGCVYEPFEGTVIGDYITLVAGEYGTLVPVEGDPSPSPRFKMIWSGLLFWEDEQWKIKGSFVGSEIGETCSEVGRWGVFNAWPEEVCQCPPD